MCQLGQITPVSLEVQSGDQMAAELEKMHGGVLLNPRIQEYVRSIGQRLVQFSPRRDFKHSFVVLNDAKVVNAFALGNGNVYVTMALLKMLDDEAELAEVVGHEIGHVAYRHIAHNIDKVIGYQGLTMLLDALTKKKSDSTREFVKQATDVTASIVINGFSRNQELESDAAGLTYMAKAGYDPRAAVRVFQKFQKLEGETNAIEAFFRSHPTANVRVDELEKVISANFTPGGNDYRERYQQIVHGVTPAGGRAVAVVGTAAVAAIAAGAIAAAVL